MKKKTAGNEAADETLYFLKALVQFLFLDDNKMKLLWNVGKDVGSGVKGKSVPPLLLF